MRDVSRYNLKIESVLGEAERFFKRVKCDVRGKIKVLVEKIRLGEKQLSLRVGRIVRCRR
jgi:hypothetical protein